MPLETPPAPAKGLTALNTHAVGYAGLAGGGIGISAILIAIWKMVSDLSNGTYVLELYNEHLSGTFGPQTAHLVGLLDGIAGATLLTVFSGIATYFARPKTIA
jgi:hypothetical protein